MGNINVAVVLSDKRVLAYLVSVDECAIDLKSKDEFPQFGLDFCAWYFGTIAKRRKDAERICASGIHLSCDFRIGFEVFR